MHLRLAICLAASTHCGAAFAQAGVPPTFEDGWKFNLGIGVASQPKFPGSDAQRTSVLPMLGAAYGRYFIGVLPGEGSPAGAGAGMFLLRDAGWSAGVGVGANLRSPRKQSDSAKLQGMGDVPKTQTASLFVNYDWRWLAMRGNVQTDIGGEHEGTTVSLDLEGSLPLGGGVALAVGPGLTWGDRRYQQTFFGVTPAQSAASGLAVDEAGSGVSSVRLNLGVTCRISSHWSAGLRANVGRLTGPAADSAVTESKDQNTFGLVTTYGF